MFKKKPAVLNGVDISSDMIALAKKHVPASVEIFKSNGTQLPFGDHQFDIIFTATVLQHNTDDAMLRELIAEICRVSGDRVYIFERIESSIKGDALCLGRPVDYYTSIFKAHGFELQETQFINIRVSYYICGAIRKLLNPKDRKEGEPLNGISIFLQNAFLLVTPLLDRIFTSGKDVGKLVFKKIK
ncbi:MAG: class I SAM-dependent methyltransferase [Saprospiraceae bacterium]|nr:class I SAM-dependent methyltransferase [Saprospiraceae bacterium]